MPNVLISYEEYLELLDRDDKLQALESGGVDDWEWYSESLNQYRTEKESLIEKARSMIKG